MNVVATEIERERDAGNPAEEAARFLMKFATDIEGRASWAVDKNAFLARTDLTDEARQILAFPDAAELLSRLATETSFMMVVIILETVTTDVIVV